MGVFYLLGYIFGSLLLTLGGRDLILNIQEGESPEETWPLLVGGAAIVLVSAFLQALVVRRRGDSGVLDKASGLGKRFLLLAGVAWLLPTVVAWVQFESFSEPVYMFPVITIAGAVALSLGVASRATRGLSLRAPVMTSAMAVFGLPLGLVTVGLPMNHFNHHLSDVVVFTFSDAERTEHRFAADDPFFDEHEDVGIGDETRALLSALAGAKEVDVDVEEEIAAGRMKRLDDGSYVTANADGTFPTVSATEEFTALFDKATDADAELAAVRRSDRRAAWEDEMDRRRNGGRLFSR